MSTLAWLLTRQRLARWNTLTSPPSRDLRWRHPGLALRNGGAGGKWSRRRRRAFAALALGGAATLSMAALPQDIGPIYRFQEEKAAAVAAAGDEEEDQDDRLPLRYDAQRIKRYWDRRPVEVFVRSLEVLRVFAPFLAKLVLWEILVRRKIRDHEGLQRRYAVRLREILTELGPCFIKFGQALSIRPDILPSPVLAELQKLCDAVPSFPAEQAVAVMAEELGRDPLAVFDDLDLSTLPVAAASLGQVYRLRLSPSEMGDGSSPVVAVKVQRPDMLEYILKDLYILRNLARLVEFTKGLLTNQRPYDVALLDAFAEASLLELDYLNEAANQERFRKDLMPKMKGKVYVPAVYHKLTTRKVLVTEWIEGEQLAKSPPEVINRLTKVGVECFLAQLLETGYFHADPHPGNLLVTPDGRLALIDFGLCAEVPLPDTEVMTLALVHLMQGDVRGLIDDAIQLGFLPDDVDVDRLYPDLQKVYDSGQLAVESADIGSLYKAVTSRRRRFMAVSFDLNRIFFEYPFLVPNYFALITRAMIVLEGIAVTGDPAFDLFASAYPYATRRAVSLFGLSNLSQIAKEAYLAQKRLEKEERERQMNQEGCDRQKRSFFGFF